MRSHPKRRFMSLGRLFIVSMFLLGMVLIPVFPLHVFASPGVSPAGANESNIIESFIPLLPETYPKNHDFSEGAITSGVTIEPASYTLVGETSETSAQLDVPADAQAVHFRYTVGDVRDGQNAANLFVDVLSGPDFATVTRIDDDLVRGTLNQGWQTAGLDLQDFQGQTVKLRFRNWGWWPARSQVTDLSITTDTPRWKPSQSHKVRIVADGYSLPAHGNYLQMTGDAHAVSSAFELPPEGQYSGPVVKHSRFDDYPCIAGIDWAKTLDTPAQYPLPWLGRSIIDRCWCAVG